MIYNMKMNLDQIEARLQSLIESSLAIFARSDVQQRLAHQLVQAAQDNLITGPDGQAVAPAIYFIHLNPETLSYWQEHNHLLDTISAGLQEAAREFDVVFISKPLIRLVSDPTLSPEGIQVRAGESQDTSGKTAAFTAIPTLPQQNTIPHNAFLIVEGNRIFPLNKMVINIGRRPDNHLVLTDPRVSRTHAQIRAIRGQYILFDLNSTGGTLVNGRRVHQCALKPGDVVSLSGVPLIYGEDPLPGDDSEVNGFTKSMSKNPSNDPLDIIE